MTQICKNLLIITAREPGAMLMGKAEHVRAADLRSNQPYWSRALLPWWQPCHWLWCSDSPWKTDRRLISFALKRKTCSFQSTLLIHMQMEWLRFFSDLLYMRVEEKKTLSLIITSVLNEQRFLAYRQMKGPCPTTPAGPQLQYAHQST